MKCFKLYTIIFLLWFTIIGCHEKNEADTKTNFCEQIHFKNSVSLSKELKKVSEKMQSQTGVYVLEEGNQAMISRAWLCEHAEKTIDIQYFIFSLDNVGLIACDYLVRAADRGVKVNIIVDDFMVDAAVEDILLFNSHPNINVKIYNPGVNIGKNLFGKASAFLHDFKASNQRMHNKTFIVDNKVVITGGRNVADEYFDYDHTYNFRDRDVLLIGKDVNQIKESFYQFWNHPLCVKIDKMFNSEFKTFKNHDRFDSLHEYACNPENFWPQIRNEIEKIPEVFENLINNNEINWLDSILFVSDDPSKNNSNDLHGGGKTTESLIELVQNATFSINIQSPYLVTTSLSRNLFKKAIERGVKIKILTNSLSSTDNLEAFNGYQRDRDQLLSTGVRIFEFKPNALVRSKMMKGALIDSLSIPPIFGLHAKTMVIDDSITVIGTFNLDPRSANLNTECFVQLNSKAIAKKVMNHLNEEFLPQNAWETTHEYNPDEFAGSLKRFKTSLRKIVPKSIL